LKKYKSQGKAVEVTLKEGGKLLRLLSVFRSRIRPQDSTCRPLAGIRTDGLQTESKFLDPNTRGELWHIRDGAYT
jgi:hypothetical protein